MYVGELQATGIVEGMEVIREKVFLEAVEACTGEIAEVMHVPLSSLVGKRVRVKEHEPELQKAVGQRKKHVKKEEQVEEKIKNLVEESVPEDKKSSRKRKKMRPGKSQRASKRTKAKKGKGKGKK